MIFRLITKCKDCGTQKRKEYPEVKSLEVFHAMLETMDIGTGKAEYFCTPCNKKTTHGLIGYTGATFIIKEGSCPKF